MKTNTTPFKLLKGLLVIVSISLNAQNQEIELLYQLKNNVVRVTSIDNCFNESDNGFGFIVSESCSYLLIATAYHVVCGPEVDVSVSFITDQAKKYPALVKNSYEDIALLEVAKPENYRWRSNSLSKRYKKRDKLRIIGAEGSWKITTDNEQGKLLEIDTINKALTIDMSISKGSSGGPILNASGIIGMIVKDGEVTTAIQIEALEATIRNWGYSFQLVPSNSDKQQSALTDKVRRQLKKNEDFLTLERLIAIYSLLNWSSCTQDVPYVETGNNFGYSNRNFNLICDVFSGYTKPGALFDCFTTEVEWYSALEQQAFMVPQLTTNEDYWYSFDWDLLLGYPALINVNPEDGNYALRDIVSTDTSCEDEIGKTCIYTTYVIEIDKLWVSNNVNFLVSSGYTEWYADGSLDMRDEWVVYYGDSEDPLTVSDLKGQIALKAKALGIEGKDVEQIAQHIYFAK